MREERIEDTMCPSVTEYFLFLVLLMVTLFPLLNFSGSVLQAHRYPSHIPAHVSVYSEVQLLQ